MIEYCHILLIEDDQWLRDGLELFLVSKHYKVTAVDTLAAARAVLNQTTDHYPVRLIVSDISLPDGTALSLFDELYAEKQIGKIFISAHTSEQERIKGLQSGADDYLCKPISPEELLLRIKAVLRRLHLDCEEITDIHFLHYQLNPESRMLSYENKQVQLSSAEHQLLLQLIARQGKIVSRDILFSSLDNAQIYQQGRALDILVSRLRRKMLGATKLDPIITYRGKGYMLLQQN
jgi:two-component system torCAD operon response regulator TorR